MSAPQNFSLLANDLPEEIQERVDIIRHKLKFTEAKPTVICIEQLAPLSIAGSAMHQLINLAGGLPDETLTGADIIVLILNGYSIERTIGNIDTLLALPGFAELNAIKNNRLYICDGEKYFRPSDPQPIDSLEILAEIINPKQFNFGFEGMGWIKFSL